MTVRFSSTHSLGTFSSEGPSTPMFLNYVNSPVRSVQSILFRACTSTVPKKHTEILTLRKLCRPQSPYLVSPSLCSCPAYGIPSVVKQHPPTLTRAIPRRLKGRQRDGADESTIAGLGLEHGASDLPPLVYTSTYTPNHSKRINLEQQPMKPLGRTAFHIRQPFRNAGCATAGRLAVLVQAS